MPAYIPSPPINSFHLGPLVIHFYALMYLVGIAAAVIITRRRYRAVGGDPDLVGDVALWSVPAGIIGGRIYFDITTPMDIPHVWYGPFAVWDGGLGIWGGVALAAVVGVWRLRRHGVNVALFMDAVAPALLVAGLLLLRQKRNASSGEKSSFLGRALKVAYWAGSIFLALSKVPRQRE